LVERESTAAPAAVARKKLRRVIMLVSSRFSDLGKIVSVGRSGRKTRLRPEL
jgi:hypothetical protein